MARQARISRNRGRLQIANLANHDDVRGLTQNGAQRDWKCHSDIVVDLHLVDPGHLIFDRFFHGDDLAVRLIDVVEAGVKGARFARTSRAGYEQNSIGRTQQPLEFFLIVAEEAEFGQAEEQARSIENTHDNAFAMVRRDGGNTQINRFLFDLHLNASVLRQTLFRDTHRAGHNLEAKIDFITNLMLKDVSRFLGRAVVFDQGLANFFRRRTNQLEVALEKKIEAVNGIDVERIANGEDQPGFTKSYRDDLEAARVR